MTEKVFLLICTVSLTAILAGCMSTESEGEGITAEKVAKQAAKMAIRRSPIAILKAVK